MKNETWSNDPLPWLLTLEMSRQRGDFEKAAEAKKELAKLGVHVTYSSPKDTKMEAARAAN
jgi:hypothetical protein